MTTRVVQSQIRANDFASRTNNPQAKGCCYCCARICAYFEKWVKKQNEGSVGWHGNSFDAPTTPSHLSSSKPTFISVLGGSKTEMHRSESNEHSSIQRSTSFYPDTAMKVDEAAQGALGLHISSTGPLYGIEPLEGPAQLEVVTVGP